jgi:HAD superfamily hydrolase (TIGR01450 family)
MSGAGELVSGYDLVIFDLDGVLYIGDQPVSGAPEAVTRIRKQSVGVVYATNNASRAPETVADVLSSFGVPAESGDVLTSAQAAAAVLAERYESGSAVLVVGAPALSDQVRRAGLRPVRAAADGPAAVVQGYGPEVGWASLAEASVAIRAGAAWVATNTDRTLPSSRGPLPGNGAMVAALATALDRQPDSVVGKPDPGLFQGAVRARGAQRALVVGDRLDTDIEGANRAGLDSLLVLTGIHQPADVLAAGPAHRPTYVAANLDGMFAEAHRVPATDTTWRVTAEDATLVLDGDGSDLDALGALCAVRWADGRWPASGPMVVRGVGDAAPAALARLGLRQPGRG